MQNGRVSLVAKDATVRQILAEWARVGQTKIVNVERVPGGPVTLELTNVPEAQALDVLLRVAERLHRRAAPGRSREPLALRSHHRDADARGRAAGRRSSPPPPVFQQAPQFPPPPAGRRRRRRQAGAERARCRRRPARAGVQHVPAAAGREPAGPTPMAAARTAAAAAGAATRRRRPSPTPVAPYGGVAVPGMVAPPPPPQPGQVQQAPAQPIRRPGGPGGQ